MYRVWIYKSTLMIIRNRQLLFSPRNITSNTISFFSDEQLVVCFQNTLLYTILQYQYQILKTIQMRKDNEKSEEKYEVNLRTSSICKTRLKDVCLRFTTESCIQYKHNDSPFILSLFFFSYINTELGLSKLNYNMIP